MTTRSHGLLDQVDNLILQAKQAPLSLPSGDGDFIQSQLVRYGCLLACAAIEQALIESIANYGGRVGDERVKHFISEILKTGRNPQPEYIRDTMGRLETIWGQQIFAYIETEIGLDKIRSIVSNRNKIAHGEAVSMGVRSLMDWTPAARKLCLELNRMTREANPRRR